MKKKIICGLAVSLLALSCNGTALGELPMPHLCETLSASAEQAPVTYIDENGVEQTITEYKLLTGNETEIGSGTFVVNKNVSYTKPLKITGNTKLILCDDCTMSVYCGGKDYTYIYFSDPENEGEFYDLSIYGQSKNTGTLSISRNYSQKELRDIKEIPYWDIGLNIPDNGLYGKNANVTLNGGTVDVNCFNNAIVTKSFTLNGGTLKSKCNETALSTDMFTMNGGSCEAVSIHGTAIRCKKFEFNGGNMKANGGTLSWSHYCDRGAGISADEICISSGANDTFLNNRYWLIYAVDIYDDVQRFMTVKITDGQTFMDQDGNTYSGTYSGENVKVLDMKTLRRAYSLTLPKSTAIGSVTADKGIYYKAGDTVKLNVVAEPGFEAKSVFVNGKVIKPTDNVFSFTMPSEDVKIGAIFAKNKYTCVPAVEPTYTSDGNKEYYYDSDGNFYFKDPNSYGYFKTEKDSWIIPKMTLIHYEAVEPTPLENGNIEYWYDPENNLYFSDEEGVHRISKAQTVKYFVPSNPTPTEIAQVESNLVIRWSEVSCAEKYAVAAFINNKWRIISECSETSCVLEGMTPGVEYKLAVMSKFNGEWYNGQLKEFYVTLEPPNTFPIISAVDYNEEFHQFRIKWNAAEGAEKYGVAVKIGGSWKVQKYTNNTSFISPKLTQGSTVEVAVCAKVNGKMGYKRH